MKTEETLDRIMTLNQAASYLKIHPNTLRKMIKDGKIRAARLSESEQGKYRIRLKDIDEYFSNRGEHL
jgi:excisionase family DNA binding protein